MSNFIPDEISKTVVIPVKVVNGQIAAVHGDGLPAFNGHAAEGELILPAYALADQRLAARIQEEREVEILREGATVLLAVRRRDTPKHLVGTFHEYVEPATQDRIGFVQVILKEAQVLRLRGTKKGELRPTPCVIPALNREAISLNQTYTFVSEAFEPERQSHTGNVFQGGRYFDGKAWRELEDLRQQYEREDIARRFRPDADSLNADAGAQTDKATSNQDTDQAGACASAPGEFDISRDMLPRLRAHFSHWVRPDLSEVRIMHRAGTVWLESAARDRAGQNESVQRTNLHFLSGASGPLFPPASSAQENAEQFLREMDAFLIVHFTHLFTPEGAWEAAQSYRHTQGQAALLF